MYIFGFESDWEIARNIQDKTHKFEQNWVWRIKQFNFYFTTAYKLENPFNFDRPWKHSRECLEIIGLDFLQRNPVFDMAFYLQ